MNHFESNERRNVWQEHRNEEYDDRKYEDRGENGKNSGGFAPRGEPSRRGRGIVFPVIQTGFNSPVFSEATCPFNSTSVYDIKYSIYLEIFVLTVLKYPF